MKLALAALWLAAFAVATYFDKKDTNT